MEGALKLAGRSILCLLLAVSSAIRALLAAAIASRSRLTGEADDTSPARSCDALVGLGVIVGAAREAMFFPYITNISQRQSNHVDKLTRFKPSRL
jgi:hypothetical protein